MKEGCVAAIDQGTTSTRCILFDAHARPIASSQREHEQIFPRAGWVEHDALEIWTNTQHVVRDAAAKADVNVAALGITNQRETIVVWDRTSGRPYANAIVWQDTRTREFVEQLAEHGGHDRWRARTGLPLATYFSGPKIAWLLNEHPELRDEVQRERALCGTMESWLIWNLTGGVEGGVHVTDVTNASRTQLMNLETLDWDEEILGELELPRVLLARIVSNGDRDGWGTTDLFGSPVPVCAAIGDQQGALVGQGCFARGDAKNTYGTGCFLLANTGTEPVLSDAGLLTTLGYRLPGERAVYALEGSVAVAGSLVQWLRDNLGLFGHAHEVEELASRAEDSGGMYIVPAFSGLFAPHWRSDARGVFVGLTRFIDKTHIARAALEATCFQTRDVLEAMRHDTGADFDVLRVDGGMVVNELLMQFQADVLGTPVARPVVAETTSLGSAYVAGLAKDFFPAPEEFRTAAREARRWTPVMGEDERERRYAGWKRAIERSLNWVD